MPDINWGRVRWHSSLRLFDAVFAAIGLVIVATSLWFQLPIIIWVYLLLCSRLLPPWMRWFFAVWISANLAAMTGIFWGITLLFSITTIGLAEWVGQQSRNWVWIIEVIFGGVWLALFMLGKIPSIWGVSILVVTVAGLLLSLWRQGDSR